MITIGIIAAKYWASVSCYGYEIFVDFLFLQGKRLVFVTNNSTKSRKQYGKKFETLGLNVKEVS